MPIYKYNVISPNINIKKPYLNDKGFFVVPNIGKSYRYYIECSIFNNDKQDIEYFLLLSNIKFDNRCRRCNVDNFCRLKVKLHNEMLEFVTNEIENRGNVDVEYVETEDNYDVYIVE